jgi:hypothetical protein
MGYPAAVDSTPRLTYTARLTSMFATILLMLLVGVILCAILIACNEILARRFLSRH